MSEVNINLKNGKTVNSIDELNEKIQNNDCGICWKENCDDEQCNKCLLGDNYISYFRFVGIKSIECKECSQDPEVKEFNHVKDIKELEKLKNKMIENNYPGEFNDEECSGDCINCNLYTCECNENNIPEHMRF